MSFSKNGAVGGLIVFGTTTSLFAKIVYELKSVGSDGTEKYFHKPWAMTTIMFVGMSLCLPMALLSEKAKKKKAAEDAEEPLLPAGEQDAPKRNELKETLMLGIPTFFDLLATVLMNVGLLWVTASVYQMMRGAEMLFAAFFAVTFLKRSLNTYHMMGLCCCVAGIMLVGSASLLSGEGSATMVVTQDQMIMGMALIVVSQAVQAAQLTFEDFFMADMDIAPMKIVGYEGVFGAAACLLVMAPVTYYMAGTEGEGFHEDIVDTWTMISHSPALQSILLIDMFALLMYNVSGMMVTFQIGAVFRTVLETMRTLFVWLVDLGLFYGGFGLGESWTVYSWMQAAGFIVLVCGTLVYNQGDEAEYSQQMEEARSVMQTEEPREGDGSIVGGAQSAMPIGMSPSAPSAPMAMTGSFKPMSTITVGSYHRIGSLPMHHGSIPRSVAGSHATGGFSRGQVITHGAAGTDSDDE
ncbi:hypothetical protein FOA52_004645 [Chlamydomonas sp. UWO 241]|nr:hypothetical protein FOA52_004645 [Chlamydomonas sp. UWO 241]